MPFRRAVHPRNPVEHDLTAAMVGIGMLFAGQPARDPNIEDTVLAASLRGLEDDDLRVLAVLTTWIGVHGTWLNADRLTRIVTAHASKRVRAYWSAIAVWRSSDARFRRLRSVHSGRRIDLLGVGTDFQIGRRGEDERFAASPLRVPAGTLRDRARDVLEPHELAARHRPYHWRVVIGPSYRADMWAELERDPSRSPAEIARRAYGSFATAWQVRRDYGIAVAHDDRRPQ